MKRQLKEAMGHYQEEQYMYYWNIGKGNEKVTES